MESIVKGITNDSGPTCYLQVCKVNPLYGGPPVMCLPCLANHGLAGKLRFWVDH